jgi:hypothetical protein
MKRPALEERKDRARRGIQLRKSDKLGSIFIIYSLLRRIAVILCFAFKTVFSSFELQRLDVFGLPLN